MRAKLEGIMLKRVEKLQCNEKLNFIQCQSDSVNVIFLRLNVLLFLIFKKNPLTEYSLAFNIPCSI